MVAQFFKGYASLEVTRPREVATDLTFLTGFGSKFKINYMGIFDEIFLHQVKELIFSGPHAKFQP
jgi:hypothetical protein